MRTMMTVKEVSEHIQTGARLLVAGDERLLERLPRGAWIGGTIPYFMADTGGTHSRDRLQVTVLPEFIPSIRTRFYDQAEVDSIPSDYPANGFSYIILPAFTPIHQEFAQDCSMWPGVFERPLVGWVAGIDLNDMGKAEPAVFDGETGEISRSKAVVMHVDLPDRLYAAARIFNLFDQGSGDSISFPTGGFRVKDCLVNGERRVMAEYLTERHADSRLPLVADYCGAMVNVSFQGVEREKGEVLFYAPVFPGIEYKIAQPVQDYETEFRRCFDHQSSDPLLSVNCVLNYLYAGLEGKKTGHLVGPMTFGEVAYMLLNQTLVYLTLENKEN